MKRIAGFLAMVMVLTMVSIPTFAADTPEDLLAAFAMDKNYALIDDDFSEDTGLWVLEGSAKIEDGQLIVSDGTATTESELSRAYMDTSSFKIEGKWYLTFEMMVDGYSAYRQAETRNSLTPGSTYPAYVICGLGMTKKYLDAYWRSDNVLNTYSGGVIAGVGREGETWEYIYEFTNHDMVDIWAREKGSSSAWVNFRSNWPEADRGNTGLRGDRTEEKANDLRFYSSAIVDGTHAHVIVDNVRIFTGAYARVDAPTVTADVVTSNAVFRHSNPDDAEKRNLSLITAVYDERGYTAAIKEKRYADVSAGGENGLTDTMAVPDGVTEPKAATMIWNSGADALPLGASAEEASRNLATGKPEEGQAEGLTYTYGYNEVRIQGFVGYTEPRVTASLVDGSGVLHAAVETIPNREGMIDMMIAIDPKLPAGDYILQIRYGNTALPKETLALHTETDVNFQSLAKEDMQLFLENYSTREKVDGVWTSQIEGWLTEPDFADEVYDRFAAADDYVANFGDLYSFRDVLEPVLTEEINERTRLKEINAAADPQTGNWDTLRTLLTVTYKDELFIPVSVLDGIKSEKGLFMRMLNGPYNSDVEVLAAFNAAVLAQKQEEAGSGSGGGFGGGLGGGIGSRPSTPSGAYGAGGTVGVVKDPETSVKPEPIKDTVAFNDLAGFDWAKSSIEALQKNQIISGDGDGNFYPDRAVSREEFLKMAMSAAGLGQGGTANFNDVDKNEWYYGYIAAACEKGIIQGISESEFGIGQQITRADMAVILKRILDACGIEIDALQPTFIFDDFDSIPKYARDSITDLCRAKLMQGVGDNRFDAGASATRAEAAVAIQRIYTYMAERR